VCHGLRCRCNELQGRKRGETEGDGRDTGEEELERSGSVPRILRDGANPYLEGIFARERLRSRRSPSKQPWERIRSAPLPRLSNQTHGNIFQFVITVDVLLQYHHVISLQFVQCITLVPSCYKCWIEAPKGRTTGSVAQVLDS
jgi:hypothetical protein